MAEAKIKGSSVNNLLLYVKEIHGENYSKWFENLPKDSKEILSNPVLHTQYYNLKDARIVPMQILADICYEGNIEKVAYDSGIFGGKKALSGIYSIFIKIPSIEFIIKRATTIIQTYYEGITIEIIHIDDDLIKTEIKGFTLDEFPMLVNIAGWIDNLLSNVTKRNYKIIYDKNILKDNKILGVIAAKFEK